MLVVYLFELARYPLSNIYIYIYIYIYIEWLKFNGKSVCSWRCQWCNGYRRRKRTRRHEFKSWLKFNGKSVCSWRWQWCNGYRRRKRTRRHEFKSWLKFNGKSVCSWRCQWCNGYRRRKRTRRHEFKSWTRLIALPWERYESNYSPSSYGKIVGQTRVFRLDEATNLLDSA